MKMLRQERAWCILERKVSDMKYSKDWEKLS